jgi:hypothetical protein
VKFSPRRSHGDLQAQRVADLLVAEHVVHQTLLAAGRAACPSSLLEVDGRVFLEVARFDRTARGRRGALSLFVWDGEYVGSLRTWRDTGVALSRLGLIDAETRDAIVWRGFFGRCLANDDMHHGNLALLTRGARAVGLAPSYDMLPMAFMPRHGHLVTPVFEAPVPLAAEAAVADSAREVAIRAWRAIADHPLVSAPFRAVSEDAARRLEADVPRQTPHGAGGLAE